MPLPFLRSSGGPAPGDPSAPRSTDLDLAEVRAGLLSLQANCLTNLAGGLGAMASGDLTVAVAPVTSPIRDRPADPAIAELVDLFNTRLSTAQTALERYEQLRGDLREALGDHSSLEPLHE